MPWIKPQRDCTQQDICCNPFTGYFRDCITRIDLVCVIRPRYCRGCTKLRCKCSRVRHGLIREYFTRLVALGMTLEIEQGLMPEHQHLTFIKIHAPDDFLDKHGEYFLYAKDFQDMHREYIISNKRPNSIFPWPIVSLERAYLGLIRENYPGDTKYSTLDRSRIVYEYLLNTKFRLKYMACEYTHCLTDMLRERMILDAYALHDGPYFLLKCQNMEEVTGRQVLFENWTGLSNILIKQPLHIINEYLGEKISLFFGFYGLYTFGLIFPATCGIMALVFDWMLLMSQKPSEVTKFICTTKIWPTTKFTEHWYPCTTSNFRLNFSKYVDNIYVCPNCRHYSLCPYKELRAYCDESHMIDNIETPLKMQVAPVLVFIWAAILIKIWKNRENYYTWLWEVNADHVKNLFRIHCKGLDHDLDTSLARRCCMLAWNIIQLVCIIFAALLMLYALLEYRYYLWEQFKDIYDLQDKGHDSVFYCWQWWGFSWIIDWKRKYYVYMFLGMNHMLIVYIIESLSKLILHYVTKYEQHETRKQKENAVAFRLFSISFVFTFILIVYTAFIKGQFYTHPVDDNNWYHLTGLFMENCHPLTCTDEVLVLVLSVVVMRELVFKFLPYFWGIGAKSDYSDNICLRKYPYYERERLMYTDEETDEFLMRKYHEIVIQFATVTMFVGVFPLGPLFALVSNMIDLRFCARRILIRSRRPMLHKAESIGIWRWMMFFVVFMAGLSNTMLLAVTSDYVQRHLNLQNNEDTEVFDHIDYHKINITYSDFTLFNGHNGHVDKSITFGHITMKLFTEYNYRWYEYHNNILDSPLHEYTKYIRPNEYWTRDNTICDYTMPHDHPINRTDYYNCSFVYSNTLRRHCYYRGFSKRYATSTQRAVNIFNKTRHVYSWDSKPWNYHYDALGMFYHGDHLQKFYHVLTPTLYLNGKYYYIWWYTTKIDYQGCSFANYLYWTRNDWRVWNFLDPINITSWHFVLRYWADVFHYYGEAVNWQDHYISHMKWLYFVSYMALGTIGLVFIYFCWPDVGSEVFEAYASERNLGREYEKKSELRNRQMIKLEKEQREQEQTEMTLMVGSGLTSEQTLDYEERRITKAETQKGKEKVA